jgi:hypothetical protein
MLPEYNEPAVPSATSRINKAKSQDGGWFLSPIEYLAQNYDSMMKSCHFGAASTCVLPLAEHMPSVVSGPFPEEFFEPSSRFHGERTARERSTRGHGSAKSRDFLICVRAL